MLKDVTFGQYIKGDSVIHRLDPRLKILMTMALIVLLFVVDNVAGIALCVLLTVSAYLIAKVPVKLVVKGLKPILPIVLFTAILNVFFVKGDVLVSFWKLEITKQGLFYALMLSVRIICLVAISSLLTYTASPIELTDAIERLLKPLKIFKLPVHELAMMMTIALRFIPTLIEETDRIMSAQKSRGAELDTGSLKQRAKALVPVLVPLFVSALRRADELAMAMECRCYRGGEGRTRMKQLKLSGRDMVFAAFFALIFAGITLTNRFFTAVI